MNVRSVNYLFALLAFVAVGIAAASWVLVALARRRPELADRLADDLGSRLRWLALAVAATATLGSLYYSEVRNFPPCELCWAQRDLMYPLVAILFIGTFRRDRELGWYVLPFAVLGPLVSTYHLLVENVSWFKEGSTCGLYSCTEPPVRVIFPVVSLAFMALAGFLAVGALVALDAAIHRGDAPARVRGGSTGLRIVALVATGVPMLVGLYQTQVQDLYPIDRLWYARVVLYPIVLVVAVATLRRERDVARYALPFAVGVVALIVPALITGAAAADDGGWWAGLALAGALVAAAALVLDARSGRDPRTGRWSGENGPPSGPPNPPNPPDLEVTR